MSVRNLMRVMFPLLLCLLSVAVYAQIPNASFESWAGGDPVSWRTSNAPPVYTNVTSSTTAHTGALSAYGIVITLGPSTVQPTLQSGPTARGSAWTTRSASFTGYYQFFPTGGDRFGINVGLFKNGLDGIYIAAAASADPTARSTWTAFDVPFVYMTSDIPDTCIVQILIAGPDALTKPHAGSYFLLDDIALSGTAAVDEPGAGLPRSTELGQNYPNPFNPTTGIRYQVAGISGQSSVVSLKVYDLLGREVATLVNETKAPGTYTVRFDGNGLASGVYLYRLTAGSVVETRKMILLR